ncbi:DUF550 domain-containing protein [Salmonella enterica]|nr:DUF550 domain-containing protein [Salmonella enterica]
MTQSAFTSIRDGLNEELELARIALASLEAEPIGAFHIADQQVGGTSDYIKDGEWPIDNGVIEVYAAPPATVVPEKLPCSVELKTGLIIGKGCKTEALLTALRRRAEYYAKLEAMTPEERAKHGASIEAFKAMLPQPAPVDKEFIPKNLDKALGVVGVALPESKEEFNFQIERWIQLLIDRVIRYADEFKEQPAPVVPEECPAELPYAQVKAVADLYALCWQSGEVVTCTPDQEKATIWLNNYSGTCVQEYVKLERLQEALAGNSPVIPDDWVMVPKEPTRQMMAQGHFAMKGTDRGKFRRIYQAMITAASALNKGEY